MNACSPRSTSFVNVGGGSYSGPQSTPWQCPPEYSPSEAGVTRDWQSTEMHLCGFEMLKIAANNKIYRLNGVYCHKYEWSWQKTETLFENHFKLMLEDASFDDNDYFVHEPNDSEASMHGTGCDNTPDRPLVCDSTSVDPTDNNSVHWVANNPCCCAISAHPGVGRKWEAEISQGYSNIQKIKFLGRNILRPEQSKSLQIFVHTALGWQHCDTTSSSDSDVSSWQTLTGCAGQIANKIRIRMPINTYLSICGIQVFGTLPQESQKCSTGKYIDQIRVEEFLDGGNMGIEGIKFKCSNPSENPTPFINELVIGSLSGNLETIYKTVGSYFCGMQALHGHIQGVYIGLVQLNLLLCKYYDCRSTLQTQNNIENREYKLVIGNPFSTASSNPTETFEKFSFYLSNSNTPNCPLLSCDLHQDCISQPQTSINASTPSYIWPSDISSINADPGNTELLNINSDPPQLFTASQICMRCRSLDQIWTSNSFDISIVCADGIAVNEPAGFQPDQTQQIDPDQSIVRSFQFPSFVSGDTRCPIEFYQVSYDFYDSTSSSNAVSQGFFSYPTEFVQNNYRLNNVLRTFTSISGIPSMEPDDGSSTFDILRSDNQRLGAHNFKIKVWVTGRQSSYITQTLSYTLECPILTGSSFVIQPQPSNLLGSTTFVNAPTALSIFTLSDKFSSRYPDCAQVIAYEAVDQSHSGKLTYPASSCTDIPCSSWDINTSQSLTLTFKVQIKVIILATQQQLTFLSNQVTVTIDQTSPGSPNLVHNNVVSSAQYYLDEPSILEINKFQETVYGLQATNYILTTDLSSNGLPLTNPGCESGTYMTQNIQGTQLANGKIGFTIDSTRLVSSCTVRVFAELANMSPPIVEFTNNIVFSVVCGREQIQVDPSQPLQFKYALLNQVITESLNPNMLVSNKPECPISSYYRDTTSPGCSSISSVTESFSGSSLTLNIDTSAPFQEQICIKAQTALVQSTDSFKIFLTVCGNERLTPVTIPANLNSYSLVLGEPGTIQISSMFVKDQTNSLSWCLDQLSYSLATGENCDGPARTSDFEINAFNTQIELKAQNSFVQMTLCLIAETKGKVKALQKFTIDVCGGESVSLQVAENFKSFHTFDRLNPSETIQILSFEDLGINFQIQGNNCTALKYRLIENNTLLDSPAINREFNGHELTIDNLQRQLRLDKSNPFEFRGYIQAFFQGSSVSTNSPMINIIVCGYESRTSTASRDQIFRPLVIAKKEPYEEPNFLQTPYNFTDRFINNLNNSNCSLASFELMNLNSSELSYQQKRDFQMIKPQGHDTEYFIINQNFDHNYEQKFYEIEVLKYRVEFWIFAYTAGNKLIPYFLIFLMDEQSTQLTDYGFSVYITACSAQCNQEELLYWRKIYYVKPFVIEGAREDYKTMLEEVYFNSVVFDQPNNDPWDENTKFCRIKVTVYDELVKSNAIRYATANPSNSLPYEQAFEAFKTSANLEIHGETSQAIYCETHTETFQDNILSKGDQFGEEYIDSIFDSAKKARDKHIEQAITKGQAGETEVYMKIGSDKVKELNQTTQIRQMSISEIKMFYGFNENVFLDVNFDMNVKELDQEKIDQLDKALTLRVESAVDGSSIEGIWIPKYQDTNRQLCANETCEAEQSIREFKVSKYFVSRSFQTLQFKWEYWSMGSRSLRFKIDFQYPYNVSTSSGAGGQDQMKLKVRSNYILLDDKNGLQMNDTQFGNDVDFNCFLKPKKSSPKVEKQITLSVKVVAFFATVLFFSVVAMKIFKDGSSQYIWGLVHSMIIVIHMTLFRCQWTAPSNIYTFNEKLSNLTQRDQYDTDLIYGSIFNFKDKNSPIEQFEFLGYEGVIFINLSGSILINLILPIIFWIIQLLFIRFARCCQTVTVVRRISVYLGKTKIFSAITAVYLAGFLELTMSALISIKGQENAGFKNDFSSNSISAIFMMISILVMVIFIIENLYVAIVYKGQLRFPEVQEKYGFIYNGFKTDKFLTSIFQVIFMVRRILFALIIVHMSEFNGMQLVLSVLIIQIYVFYLAQLQPYEDLAQNNAEIFNDVCTMLVSYFLMWLSIFPDYTEEERPKIETIGWFYIVTASFNIIKNISSLLYRFIINIPRTVKKVRRKIFDFKYQRWKKQFVQQMQHRSKFDPNGQLVKYFGDEASKIEQKEAYKRQLEIIKTRHAKECQWVIDNNFEDPRYETYIKDSHETELANFNKMYQTKFNPQVENENLIRVKLDLNDVTPLLMPHNHPCLLNSWCFYPYREQRYIEIHQLAMVGGKELGLEEAREVNRKVFIAKQKHLLDFLQIQKYLYVPMPRDGDSGPRAIAAFKFRDLAKWPQVRQKVCKKMEQQLKKKLKNNDEAVKENFDSRLEQILSKKESGQIFTRKELQVCSNIYKLTIVVFSIFNKSRFMDYLIVPEGKPDHKSVPLYLLDHGNYYTILVHRAQQNLQRLMTSQGLELKQFKKRHFFLEDQELIKSFKSDQVRSPIEEQKVNSTSRKAGESKADDQDQKMKAKHKRGRKVGSHRKKQTRAYEKLLEKQKQKQLLTNIQVIEEQEEEQSPKADKDAPEKKSSKKTKKAQGNSDEDHSVIREKVELTKEDRHMIKEWKRKTLERQEDKQAQLAKWDQQSDEGYKSEVLDWDNSLDDRDIKSQPVMQNSLEQGDESSEETIPWDVLDKMRSKNQVKRIIRF